MARLSVGWRPCAVRPSGDPVKPRTFRDSIVSFADIAMGARFIGRLPSFLRHPLTIEHARATLRRRLERREADFLTIARRAIYEHPGSPYRTLLNLAGCEYGDLERLVSQDGVEGALRILYRHGVYLTVDEFKGRRPVARGGTRMAVDPDQLRNPRSAFHVPARSGGSRSPGTPVLLDLAFVRECAVDALLALDARGGSDWLNADWEVPGGGALFRLLKFASFGALPLRWFSQIDPASPGLHPRYRWSARVLRAGSALAGVPLPRPLHVSLDDPLSIAQWMGEVLQAGGTPHLFTFASSAVRLCQAARHAGLHLLGAQLTLAGEPITPARLAEIRRAGAEATPRYGTIECGPIGYGCLAPEAADDMHLLHDLHALIQPDSDAGGAGLPHGAFLVSSLRPTVPFIMLNVSMGDAGVVLERACGCHMERLGWITHLHTIQSYEKLTAAGMTFMDTDVIRVLEEVLPARFGGAPTDYQLVEEEGQDGQASLRLIVHPALGPLNSTEVANTLLSAIGAGSGVERAMSLVWHDADLLRVERRVPYTTASSKILHLHVRRDR